MTTADLLVHPLVDNAAHFAERKHAGQVRKFGNEPYFYHCVAVAGLVWLVSREPEMIAAAMCHDVIEDCGVTQAELLAQTNTEVVRLVVGLTDVSRPEDGNREARKRKDRQHLAEGDAKIQTIKCADIIHNCIDITTHDPHFARVFLHEKRLLIDELLHANKYLHAMAWSVVHEAQAHIWQKTT